MYIFEVCLCVIKQKPNEYVTDTMEVIETTSPFELVSLDSLHLETFSGGCEVILVLVDHFTRYDVCYATKNKTAKTAAKCMFDDFFLKYGLPNQILHDQGGKFENRLKAELKELSGVVRFSHHTISPNVQWES